MKNDIFEWIMILFPILNIYLTPIPGISVGELLLIVLGTDFVFSKTNIFLDKKLVMFYLYLIMTAVLFAFPIIREVDFSDINYLFSYILYAIYLFMFLSVGNDNSFCRRYVMVTKIVCILSLFQWLLLQFDFGVSMMIPGIPNSINALDREVNSMCGPFTEPASLAQFISIGLIISLLNKEKNKKEIFLFTVTMAFTMKGNAVGLLIAIYSYFLFRNMLKNDVKKICKLVFIFAVVIIGFVNLYDNIYSIQVLFSRVYEITGDGDQSLTGYKGLSGYFRVKYGYDIYSSLEWNEKIFGTGCCSFNHLDSKMVIPINIVGEAKVDDLINYRSALSSIFIDVGFLGFILYTIALLKDKSNDMRFFSVVLLILQCFSSTLNSPIWLIYMFLAFKYGSNRVQGCV